MNTLERCSGGGDKDRVARGEHPAGHPAGGRTHRQRALRLPEHGGHSQPHAPARRTLLRQRPQGGRETEQQTNYIYIE